MEDDIKWTTWNVEPYVRHEHPTSSTRTELNFLSNMTWTNRRIELTMFSLWWTGQEPAGKCWRYISLKFTSLGVFQEAYSSVWDPLCMAFPLRVERRSLFSFPNCQKASWELMLLQSQPLQNTGLLGSVFTPVRIAQSCLWPLGKVSLLPGYLVFIRNSSHVWDWA